jgi:hypothetical protein
MGKKFDALRRAFLRDAPIQSGGRRSSGVSPQLAFAGLATLAVASLGPTLAKAQGIDGGAPVSVGGAEKPLTIGVQAVTSYDSNPARGSTLAGEIRDVRGDEVIFSPSVTVGYSHSVGLQGLALRGVFGYDKYTRNSDLSAEHIEFSAAANRAVGGRCSVNGAFNYNRGQSNLEYVTVNVGKNVIQTYGLNAGQSCATGTGLNESLSVNHSSTHNSASDLVDFNSIGVSGSLGYSNDVVGNVSLVASYTKTNYVDIPQFSLATPSSLGATSIGVQVSRPIGARLSGSAAVFYTHSTQDQRSSLPVENGSSYSGVTASASLSYLVSPRLNLTAQLARDVSGSIIQDVGYAITNSAGLTAGYTVSSRISANLGVNWSRNSYRGRGELLPLTTPDWQETSDIFGGVSMKVGNRAAVSLDVRHERGNSDIDLYDYSSNRVSLTVSASI